jgi:hypothetical protein
VLEYTCTSYQCYSSTRVQFTSKAAAAQRQRHAAHSPRSGPPGAGGRVALGNHFLRPSSGHSQLGNFEHGKRQVSPWRVSESWAGESRSLFVASYPSPRCPVACRVGLTLRTVMRQSAVAPPTRRTTGASPSIAAKRVDELFCAGANVVARTEVVRVLPSVGRSLAQSPPRVFDCSAGVYVCLCVRACLRARAQLRHGWRWLHQQGELLVSPLPSRRSVSTNCFPPG